MATELPPFEIAGLNLGALCERVEGDIALVASILSRFVATQRGAADGLPVLVATDKEAALHRAHDLKGMLGNLGAERLFELSAALCDLLREPGPPSAAAIETARQIEQALPRLCDAVTAALPASDMGSETGAFTAAPLPADALAARLDDLADWLRRGRAREARAAVDALCAQAAGTAEQPLLRDIAKLVASYRLRDALQLLEQQRHG